MKEATQKYSKKILIINPGYKVLPAEIFRDAKFRDPTVTEFITCSNL